MAKQCPDCGSFFLEPIAGDESTMYCNECCKEIVPVEKEQTSEPINKIKNVKETNQMKKSKGTCEKCLRPDVQIQAKGKCASCYSNPSNKFYKYFKENGVPYSKDVKELHPPKKKYKKKKTGGIIAPLNYKPIIKDMIKGKSSPEGLKASMEINKPELETVKSCMTCLHMGMCFLLKENTAANPGTVVCINHCLIF